MPALPDMPDGVTIQVMLLLTYTTTIPGTGTEVTGIPGTLLITDGDGMAVTTVPDGASVLDGVGIPGMDQTTDGVGITGTDRDGAGTVGMARDGTMATTTTAFIMAEQEADRPTITDAITTPYMDIIMPEPAITTAVEMLTLTELTVPEQEITTITTTEPVTIITEREITTMALHGITTTRTVPEPVIIITTIITQEPVITIITTPTIAEPVATATILLLHEAIIPEVTLAVPVVAEASAAAAAAVEDPAVAEDVNQIL